MFSLTLFTIGFFVLKFENSQKYIYGFIGFILFVQIGILIGIIKTLSKLQKDLSDISKLAGDTLINVTGDISQFSSNENLKYPLTLIFKGILVGIIGPKFLAIATKIPFAGGIIDKGSETAFKLLVDGFKNQEEKMAITTNLGNRVNNLSSRLNSISDLVTNYQSTADRTIYKSLNIIKLLLKIFAYSISFIFIVFILIIN